MEVFNKIFSKQLDRGNYTPTKGYINYFISYEGIEKEDSYNLEIFRIKKILETRKDIIIFKQTIPNPSDFDSINYFKSKLQNYKNNVESLDIDIISSKAMNYNIKKSIDTLLLDKESEFANDRVKQNFIIKIMSWLKTYINNIEIDKNEAPIIIFYGDIKKHEIYLLIILHLAGFDILYLNPNKCNNIDNCDINKYKIENEISNISDKSISYDERENLGELIDRTSIRKAMTAGAQASLRISNELLNDSGFIKPWQLQDRKIKSLLLTSTIDEISIYYNQPTKLRPGFNFDNQDVTVPVFFSKINGVYNDNSKYLELINSLKDGQDVFFIEYDGNINIFSKEFTKEAYSLSFVINGEGIIDKNAVINDYNYSISTLHAHQKLMLLEKVEEVIANDMFVEKLSKEDMIKGLYTVLNMNKKFVYMINNFDFAMVSPKLVMYMEKGLVFNKEISFLMLLLNKMGFDIILFSPSGESCIENVVNSQLIDTHRLDKMAYELKLSSLEEEVPLFKKLFGKRSGFKWQ